MRRAALIPFAFLFACAGETPPQNPAPGIGVESGDRPVGIYMVVPPSTRPSSTEAGWLAAPAHRTIFVQRNGGTYTPGGDDSSSNVSSILDYPSTVPAYEKGDASWGRFLACIQDQFARFDVQVTDVDPGAEPHIEAVIGGRPQSIGMPDGVGGVSPMESDCAVVERAVVYIFSRVLGDAQEECEVAAQEIGHALGMDHEYLCEDPMTYLYGCGDKTFQDVDARCGEYGPRDCMCGGATQNSVQHLLSVLGPADGSMPPPMDPPPTGSDTTPPVIANIAPDDGATLAANTTMTVRADVADETALGSVVLVWEVDGRTVEMDCDEPPQGVDCSVSGDTVTWSFPVGSGPRTFHIEASDEAGNVTVSDPRSLTLGGDEPPTPGGGAPTVTVTSPSDGDAAVPGDVIPVRVTAEDDGWVVDAWVRWQAPSGDVIYQLYQLDDTTWGIDLELSAYADPGERVVRVSVWDDEGNRTTAPDVTLTVE